MSNRAYLTLENGMVFEGRSFGEKREATGEVVFATGMTGYLETLTDPSYYGQIVLQTFPLIGNYGVIPADFESDSVGVRAYIVKHPCQDPSNFRSEGDLDTFLKQKGVAGIYDIDTRALTKIIRENGVMNGRITHDKPATEACGEIRAYKMRNAVESVSRKFVEHCPNEGAKYRVALMDFGMKENIKRKLLSKGCEVWIFPHDSGLKDILSVKPDGIMLSNGPGDPAENTPVIENLKEMLAAKIPMFGICLGHQLLALARGFGVHKLKYGHRGANQPVKDLRGGRVYITSQNHGYAVSSDSIDRAVAEEWFINGNDRTCEGIIYKDVPAFSVQFHPEACGGPNDTMFLFDRFAEHMEVHKNAVG